MNITRTREGWEISTMKDGFRFKKHYINYSRAEAVKHFKSLL